MREKEDKRKLQRSLRRGRSQKDSQVGLAIFEGGGIGAWSSSRAPRAIMDCPCARRGTSRIGQSGLEILREGGTEEGVSPCEIEKSHGTRWQNVRFPL
jgi:hypothetical protein